ncbi:MAG: ECF transporter S component [Oscillospiraceae bacterium]|nr:ECF transporter S component [Oscillospiraceae bacterium]
MSTTKTKNLVILGLLLAIVIIFSTTPYGTIPINPALSITLNTIPIALAAVSLGVTGSVIMGAAFGICSFLQAAGIMMPSTMGVTLFGISPVLTFVQCVVPRALDGLCVGLLYTGIAKLLNKESACFAAGFCSAFLNTVFFMSSLVILFGKTPYLQDMIQDKGNGNVIAFIIALVGMNAVFEMLASTLITGAIGIALHRAKLIPSPVKAKA